MEEKQVELGKDMENMKKAKLNSEKIWKMRKKSKLKK